MPRDIIADKKSPGLEPNAPSSLGTIDKAIYAVSSKEQQKYVDETISKERRREANKAAMENPVVEETSPAKPYTLITQTENDKGVSPNSPGFMSLLGNEIDNGMGANLYGLVQNYGDKEPESEELFLKLTETADKLTKQYGWDSTIIDELMVDVQSTEEMERKAKRIYEQQGFMASLENTSMAKQFFAGLGGFILDPVNLIPGGIVLKGGSAAARVFPKVANALQRTTGGKAATWGAMGAIEEAARNYPRLMNDPTYSYEMYRMDVALGAMFGGGLATMAPVGRLAKTQISKGVNKAMNKYQTSLEARLAVNTLTDTLRFTHNPEAQAAVAKAIKETLGPEQIAAAKKAADVERAQRQVDESTVNIKFQDVAAKFKKTIEDGKTDAESIVAEFTSELKKSHPTMAKIAEALAERVKRAADAAEAKPKSAGAAARKETIRTKVQDAAHDAEEGFYKEALDDIDRAFDLAEGVARGAKDVTVERQLNALRSIAKRAVVEKAKIAGVKPRMVASDVEVNQATYKKFKDYQKKINRLDFELNKTLKEAGIDDRNIMSPTVGKSFKQVGVIGYKNLRDALKKDIELATRLENVLDENMQRVVDDIYAKAPNADPALYEALTDAYKQVRADVSWAKLVIRDRNAAQVAMEPEWALLTHEFQQMMGDDFAVLDDLYNTAQAKILRNQFGPIARSYAGELAASRTPLAQWLALYIFELPGGTGGKVARRETAAISMEMYMAEAVHPVNVAWDKAVRAEAKARGLGMFDSAVMRHSSAAADKNANALGRQVQLEMNARQMGTKIDSSPHVKAYADELEKSYDLLYKRMYENGVEGITGMNKIKSYMRQSWSEARVMQAIDGELGQDGFEELVAKALKNRQPDASPGELKQRAKAIIDRMDENINNRSGIGDNNIVSDGDYINERLLHLDLSTSITRNGKEFHLLDLMSNDVTSDLNKYAKKTSAQAAISKASGGKLNSADAITSFIHAVGSESQAMGTHVDVGDMTNAFKIMMGEPINNTFGPNVRKIRDAVSLSGMNGLGESQLAELGLAMNRGTAAVFAAKQVLQRVKGKHGLNRWNGMMLTEAQLKSTKFLEELQSVSTLYDQMHNLARQNVHFDEMHHGESTSATIKGLNKVVDFGTGGKYRPVLQHVQTKHTGYGSIRTMQEQVAMAGLMHDAGRKLAGKATSYTSDARMADIGIPMDLLRKKMDDGTLTLNKDGNIVSLGIETWSKKEQHTLGVALRRHAAQQVQVGFAGEGSAIMNNPWVAFMMQFRSYPNIAAEKQQLRNAMFADKEAAMGMAMNTASSMAARIIRYESLALALPENQRESYLDRMYARLGEDTLVYTGFVGTMFNTQAMIADPSEAIPPVFSWANNYVKAAKGLTNGLQQRDLGNIASAVPLGTIMQLNIINGNIRDATQEAQAVGQMVDAVRGGQEEMDILTENVSTTGQPASRATHRYQ